MNMVLVFGSGGFIGTYLINQLAESNCRVVACDQNKIGEDYCRKLGVPFHRIDITKRDEFERLPSTEIDAVVHLACVQPANISIEKYTPESFINVNVLGTINILEFCRKHRIPKLIYTCSHRNTQGMWLEKNGSAISEADGRSLLFTGDYAMFSISESAAADCVEHYTQSYGLNGIILRLPPVYGYGPHTEIFKDGLPIKTGFQIFIERAKQGLPIELWGNPNNGRDIVYVKDVVTAIQKAISISIQSGVLNIASGHQLTLLEQVETIIKLFSPLGHSSPIMFRPEIENNIETYVYNIEKAKKILGWNPEFKFADMLRDYQVEAESCRFEFLLEKRRRLFQGKNHE